MENCKRNKSSAVMERHQNEPFYHNEIVDVFDIHNKTASEAIIISIRGNIHIIKYTKTNEEEVIRNDDKIILKQWKSGRELLRFNRVDIKSSSDNCYYIGLITYVDSEKFKVLYKIKNEIVEETLPINSNRISEIGKYTQNKFYSKFSTSEEINSYLNKRKKIFQSTNKQETNFREDMNKINRKIKEIKEDGNCLYRAIAHQLYGNEDIYAVVKNNCMEYLELEKEFFGQFIDGGIEKFSEYIELKRRDGVWGDDVELQAISELYDRPIEIYCYSIEPLKTFHENKDFNRFGGRNENSDLSKINISYHGNSHYNSVVSNDDNLFFKKLLKSKPGVFEEKAIEKLKKSKAELKATSPETSSISIEKSILSNMFKENQDKNNHTEISKNKFEDSREDFIYKRQRDIDSIIDQRLVEISKKRNDILDKNRNNLESAINQSEQMMTEEELIQSVLEMSKNENNISNTKYLYNTSNNNSVLPSIQFIVDMGFTSEEAIMALSAVGEDPELMLQYLFSLNHD